MTDATNCMHGNWEGMSGAEYLLYLSQIRLSLLQVVSKTNSSQ